MSNPSADRQWKDKYLTALEEHEKLQARQQQFLSLFSRAVVRMSLLADGIDPQLDQQLSGLRRVLREESPKRSDLNTLFDALEGQVKRIEVVKSERARIVLTALTSMLKQLDAAADKSAKTVLGRLRKQVKGSAGASPYIAGLLAQLAEVQKQVLETRPENHGGPSLWQRLTRRDDKTAGADPQLPESTIGKEQSDKAGVADEPDVQQPVASATRPAVAPAFAIDASHQDAPLSTIEKPDQEEPPFSRISRAICDVLDDMLVQIEPPRSATANYQFVRTQVDKGLNWYELVPTLEELSVVVLSAFDQNQKEFERFLAALNERLSAAHAFIDASQELNNAATVASGELDASVREQVSAIQESVAEAHELEQLKSEVSHRLDKILSAVDQFQTREERREVTLAEQLDALVTRVKAMEHASADAEKRIEEQRQKALLDVLTQLPNREAYQQRVDHEYERWQRYQRPLTMAVCDIDFFKKINDNYGHLAGDKVLRIVAKTLSKRLRKTDFVARFGGEEFVVLLPETNVEQAFSVMDAMREAIAKCPFHFKDKPVTITLSFGVAEFTGEAQPESVFEAADKALYEAKGGGRNQGRRAAA